MGATSTGPVGRVFLHHGAGGHLEHLPALDGLRGLAVAAVVCFHGGWPWATGGFLGVSLFFTLSGFLITSLLIAEFRRTGGVDLRSFWGRRFRRLLPASLLTLAVVTAVLAAWGELTAATRLDVWAAVANVANWRFLAAGSSYNDLFTQPSPVRHFWSLAIEEQAYLVLPFVAALVLAGGRGVSRRESRRRLLGVVLAVGWVGSVIVTLMVSGADRVYYGTDTRASELLAGAVLATVVASDGERRRIVNSLWVRWAVLGAGSVALAATVAAWGVIAVSDPIVSQGGLAAVGVLSAVLVLAAAVGEGPVAAIGRFAPFRWLGKVSYGVYLFHWPIFVLADERRTGLSDAWRFVAAVAVTLLLAEISHRWFEMPLRRGGIRIGPLTPARLAPALVVALVAGSALVPSADPALGGFDADAAAAGLDDLARRSAEVAGTSTVAPTPTAAEPVVPVPTVAVFGDSVALSIAYPLATWSVATGKMTFVGGEAELGCGIGRGGTQDAIGIARRTAECDAWPDRWGTFVDGQQPDLALVQSAQWEIVPRQLAGDPTWRVIGDPVYDTYLHGEFLAATDTLARSGALVVWVTVPHYGRAGDTSQTSAMKASHAPERVDRLNEIIRSVAAERPDSAVVVDLAAWMTDRTEDATLRKDGAHFNSSGADRLASEFLGPELLDLWSDHFLRRWRTQGGDGG